MIRSRRGPTHTTYSSLSHPDQRRSGGTSPRGSHPPADSPFGGIGAEGSSTAGVVV